MIRVTHSARYLALQGMLKETLKTYDKYASRDKTIHDRRLARSQVSKLPDILIAAGCSQLP